MVETESRVAPLELKGVDPTARVVEGYASTFGPPVDRVGDVVVAGAFGRTIRERPLTEVGVYINHNADRLPVGVPLELREDAHGLYTKTRIFRTTEGDDLLATAKELLLLGAGLAMSIGYKARSYEWRSDAAGVPYRALVDVDLREYSYVPAHLAANSRALVASVKQAPRTVADYQVELDAAQAWLLKRQFDEEQDARMRRERRLAELRRTDPSAVWELDAADHRERALASLRAFDPLTNWAAVVPPVPASKTAEQYRQELAALDRQLDEAREAARWARLRHPGGRG